jgi:tRNA uridine 5-carboxymethylaminomethyl modification enzyme
MTRDVVVVGAGHAGIEAALAAARMGCSVLIVTASAGRTGEMSCNPAIGGIAKGTLVREIDTLGGSMAETADATSLHFSMLNTRKGPAVWGPRVQSDVSRYASTQRAKLSDAGVRMLEDEVLSLSGPTENPSGVLCRREGEIASTAVVLAAGTFLGGRLFRGREFWRGGRAGDISADSLDADLRRRGFHVKRFKTGTPPRVVRESVDTSALKRQERDDREFRFSFRDGEISTHKEECYLLRTNSRTRRAAEEHLAGSPLFGGGISGRGPRYCPSFEDKVVRFPDREDHLIHIEPMGYGSRLLYLNGLSTSLPRAAQTAMVRSLPGFGRAAIARFGYAVEYSFMDNTEIDGTLRLTRTENVFAAGQMLGTSGYEEAAALGLLAGANAARYVLDRASCVPARADSYLGVMVDDLVSRGAEEPYRLFSSRAENRLHIRQDNADLRLMPFARELGCATGEDIERFEKRKREWEAAREILERKTLQGKRAAEICRRPEISAEDMKALLPELSGLDTGTVRTAVLDEKYRGYVERTRRKLLAREEMDSVSLASVGSFLGIEEISWEAREALERHRPGSLGAAAQLPGVRYADLEGLVVFLSRKRST